MDNQNNIFYKPENENENGAERKQRGKIITIIEVVIVLAALLFCVGGCGFLFYMFFFGMRAAKPVIYLYPEERTEISVKVSNPERFTVTYPAYDNGWKVIAESDGTLTDPETLRTYYSPYYESDTPNMTTCSESKEGFLVAGEDTKEFLEEKLEILGLTDREAEEMIIYWLPQLSKEEYNLIRFATPEEIDKAMSLTISPEPDNLIRVWMIWETVSADKAEELKDELTEQELTTPEREGFTVVEWGGVYRNGG